MSSEPTPKATEPRDYEDRDIRLRPLVLFVVFTALFTVLTFFGVRLIFFSYARSEEKADRPWSKLATERQLPTGPLLQVSPGRNLAEHRAWEDEQLQGYGWVDKQAGVVKLPIDRAMDLVAERADSPPQPEEPTEDEKPSEDEETPHD